MADRLNDLSKALGERLTQALGPAYSIEGEIGRGGMGVVYMARDERLKRKVAVKVLPPDLAFREEIRLRFLREAETAARLSHPHIVPIHSVGEGPDGLVYFVMAYIDGEPLGSRLKRRGQLSPEEARRILMETADALGAAHALGIIHRDVKPDNILLEGSRGRVVVTDFGIAKALSSTTGPGTLTATGVAIGTPHYMSPEQAAGDREIDGRSDIYSLGVVGFEMLAGELPFLAPTVPGILLKQITEGAPPLMRKRPDCPEDLAACVMRSLEKEPEARWPTADALRRALESRATPAYQPRRPSTAFAPPRAFEGRAPARDLPARRSPFDAGAPARRARRELAQRGGAPKTNEPKIVQDARSSFVKWASVCGPLLVLNVATGNHIPSWSLMVGGIWMAFGLVPKYVRLWHAGYSWRDVLSRPPAPDAIEARLSPSGGVRPRDLPAASRDEFGTHMAEVQQARSDRKAIFKVVDNLPQSEKKLLPDVVATADGLLNRAEDLARTLQAMSGGVDVNGVARIDEKLAVARRQAEGPERDRQVSLLERQRQALTDLVSRRGQVEEQLQSCVIAMQNVRYDLLRLKSAGVDAVLGDLTHATQQARALSRDVDNAIAAAGEIREALGEAPSP
ncbi:MAG TPA: serine/threonine-protein kinase [Gemmatimonadales bacterium]|nr:serine/threonine-protein kinase [Gemmatimonadales bacterium]